MSHNLYKLKHYIASPTIEKWRIFEIVSCLVAEERYPLAQILDWSDVNPDLKDQMGLSLVDTGADYIAVENQFVVPGQVKFYKPGSYISAYCMERTRECALLMNWNDFKVPYVEFSTTTVKMGNPKNKFPLYGTDSKALCYQQHIIHNDQVQMWLDKAIKLEESPIPPVILRPCQLEAIDAINMCDIIEQDQCRLKLCCGAGKSLVILTKIYEELGLHVILVPSLILMNQFYETIKKHKQDMIAPVDTKIVRIGTRETRYFNPMDQPDDSLIIFICVYNSFEHICHLNFTRIWVDEAHHVDKALQESDDATSYFKLIGDAIDYNKSVMLSATLKTPDFAYTTRQAIEDGILCDYDIHLLLVPNEESIDEMLINYYKQTGWTGILVYFNRIAEAENFAALCTLNGISAKSISCEETPNQRAAILQQFKTGKIHLISSVNTLGEGVDLPWANVCCPARPRNSEIFIVQAVGRVLRTYDGKKMAHIVLPVIVGSEEDFEKTIAENAIVKMLTRLAKNDSKLLASVKSKSCRVSVVKAAKIAESFDVTEIDYKHIESIILDKTCELSLNGAWEFKLEILRAYYNEFKGIPRIRTEYQNLKIGHWLSRQKQEFNKNTLDQLKIEKLNTIDPSWKNIKNIISIAAKELSWDEKLEVLRAYYNEFKELSKTNTEYQNFKIGKWLSRQKKEFNKNTLDQDKIDKLNTIDPNWKTNLNIKSTASKELSWDEKLEVLRAYYNEFKELPKHRTESQNFKIGYWLINQKKIFNKNTLDQQKIEKLDSIDPGWKTVNNIISTASKELSWDDKLEVLRSYVDEFNKLPKTNTEYKNFKIGSWLSHQKDAFNKNTLDQLKIDKLNTIDPNWKTVLSIRSTASKELSWDEKLEVLRAYYNEFNKLPQYNTEYKNFKIGSWLDRQKTIFNKNTLDQLKIDKLDGIDPNWKTVRNIISVAAKELSWDEKLEILRSYVEEFNKFPKQRTEYKNFKIGIWLNNQKTEFTKNTLDQLNIDKLDAIDSNWRPKSIIL